MDPYIYINKNSISRDICYDIIDMFEQSPMYPSRTIGGINTNILKATGTSSLDIKNDKWSKYSKLLERELINNLKSYIHQLNCINPSGEYLHFNNKRIIFDNFNIQKYEVSESGKYIYHTDNNVDIQNHTERCITFLWYLNDVYSGGETEFFNNVKISPEIGKLLLFPSTWTYPHCSRPVISNDKYIMVGWLRINCT